MRHFSASAFTRDTLTGNPVALWMSVLLVRLQLAFTYAPPLQALFQTPALDAMVWVVILGLGALKLVAVETEKAVLRRLGVTRMQAVPGPPGDRQR